jgi:hypothetical protein
VDGIPSEEAKKPSVDSPIKETNPVRIAVTICMSNGVLVRRKNLSYDGLQKFVEKLEGLC